MNKQKRLIKKLTSIAAAGLGIIVLLGGAFYLTGDMVESTTKDKSDAESAYNAVVAETGSLRNQLEKSGYAEEGFLKIQLARASGDFSTNIETMKDVLRLAKAQFRFATVFKLTGTPEISSDRSDLQGLNYSVSLRPTMKMEFEAMSDLHVFAFLEYLEKQAPGFVRMNTLKITRKGEMDASAISEMQRGGTPFLVSATAEFSWIGITEKPAVVPGTPPANGATP